MVQVQKQVSVNVYLYMKCPGFTLSRPMTAGEPVRMMEERKLYILCLIQMIWGKLWAKLPKADMQMTQSCGSEPTQHWRL